MEVTKSRTAHSWVATRHLQLWLLRRTNQSFLIPMPASVQFPKLRMQDEEGFLLVFKEFPRMPRFPVVSPLA